MLNPKAMRVIAGVIAVAGLFLFFLFQNINFAFILFKIVDKSQAFFVNRSIRFLLNDALAIALIYSLFGEKKYTWFAVAVQIFGLIFLLMPYFVLKLYFPAYNGPLINFLHRIVLNPTLLLLLIPAFYYQKFGAQREKIS